MIDAYGVPYTVCIGVPPDSFVWESDAVRQTYGRFNVPWDSWRPILPISGPPNWQTKKRKIFVQERGGGPAKRHPYWFQIANYLEEFGEVFFLDGAQCRRNPVLKGLATAKSSDWFIGWDSGPLYASLAGQGAAYAVFPYGRAEDLAASLGGRVRACQCGQPSGVAIHHFLKEIVAHFGIEEAMEFSSDAGGLYFVGENCHGHLYSGHEDWLKPYLDPEKGDVCADIGAHIGTWTCWMARAAGRVYSFEPSPGPAAAKTKTARVRGLHNVIHMPVALSNVCGATVMSRDRGGTYMGADSGDAAMLSTLDKTFAKESRLDLVKIDTEGAEARILEGGFETLKRLKPRLVIEVHQFAAGHFDNDPYRAIAAALAEAKYTFRKIGGHPDNFYLEAVHESRSFPA